MIPLEVYISKRNEGTSTWKCIQKGAWVAQSVKGLLSAQVIWSQGPGIESNTRLPACFSLSLCLLLPLLVVCQINKIEKRRREEWGRKCKVHCIIIIAKSGKNSNIHQHMSKQNVIYPYNGILFNHKKKSSTDICHNLGEPWKHHTKWMKQT